jgi:hypothetical protein
MKTILPPDGNGVWLRCQLHAHTTNSDGEASPSELCDHYAAAGFHVLAITDHWELTVPQRDDLVIIPASELSCRASCPSGEAEALALGIGSLPRPREPFADLEAMAAWVTAAGGAAFLCHPYWSGLTADDILQAPSLAGVEVWNGSSEVLQGNGLSTVHWDGVLQQGRLLPGVATDDCHSPGQDSRLGWTWVFAADRSGPAVIAALRAGRSYGSAGPRLISVELSEREVQVRCSPVRSARLRSGSWDGCAANAPAEWGNWRAEPLGTDGHGLITAARFEYPELWRWARVELEDAHGARAWGNPFSLLHPRA